MYVCACVEYMTAIERPSDEDAFVPCSGWKARAVRVGLMERHGHLEGSGGERERASGPTRLAGVEEREGKKEQ